MKTITVIRAIQQRSVILLEGELYNIMPIIEAQMDRTSRAVINAALPIKMHLSVFIEPKSFLYTCRL